MSLTTQTHKAVFGMAGFLRLAYVFCVKKGEMRTQSPVWNGSVIQNSRVFIHTLGAKKEEEKNPPFIKTIQGLNVWQ